GRDLSGAGTLGDIHPPSLHDALPICRDRDAERPRTGTARGRDVVVGVAEGRIARRRDRQRRLLSLVQRDNELGRVGGGVVGVTEIGSAHVSTPVTVNYSKLASAGRTV